MSGTGTVVLRRTWPQRIVILACLAVIAGAFGAAWFVDDVYRSVSRVGRVEISGSVLLTDTPPGAPVNFLLIGEDSALGLDPNDPVLVGREFDPRGTFNADSITVLRVDPGSGQAWVLSLPRDLIIDDQGTARKINQVLLVEGPERLVEVVSENFGIPINHYMSLDFLGFREVVDELNGIPVWFEHPARDLRSGLDVPIPGCSVLDGERSLQYVRSRHYQEFIDGEWVTIGNADFGRIERQQDFLVLALDRAIAKGARNPSTLSALIEAGAQSIVLDSELTVAELIDVGEAFSDFNPENLQRFGIQVTTEYDPDTNRYLGEAPIPNVNEPVFAVFRGGADVPPPTAVSFSLYAPDDAVAAQAEAELTKLGFVVTGSSTVAPVDGTDVVVYPPGNRSSAEGIARWLLPVPRLVEDPTATGLSLVFGTDHEQILFLYPQEVPDVREAVAAQGTVEVPDLDGALPVGAGATTSTSAPSTSVPSTTPTTATTSSDGSAAPTSTSTTTTTTIAPVSTTAPTTTIAPAAPDDDGIIGRAPEGESCG